MDWRMIVFIIVAICFLMASSLRSFRLIAGRSMGTYQKLPVWIKKIDWIYWGFFVVMIFLNPQIGLFVVLLNLVLSLSSLSVRVGVVIFSVIDNMTGTKKVFRNAQKAIELVKEGVEGIINSNPNKKDFSGSALLAYRVEMLRRNISNEEKIKEILEVTNGTKIKIKNKDLIRQSAQIEILSGDRAGEVAWILLKDIILEENNN